MLCRFLVAVCLADFFHDYDPNERYKSHPSYTSLFDPYPRYKNLRVSYFVPKHVSSSLADSVNSGIAPFPLHKPDYIFRSFKQEPKVENAPSNPAYRPPVYYLKTLPFRYRKVPAQRLPSNQYTPPIHYPDNQDRDLKVFPPVFYSDNRTRDAQVATENLPSNHSAPPVVYSDSPIHDVKIHRNTTIVYSGNDSTIVQQLDNDPQRPTYLKTDKITRTRTKTEVETIESIIQQILPYLPMFNITKEELKESLMSDL